MRIGVDLDGVVANFTKGWTTQYEAEFGKKILEKDITKWGLSKPLTHFEEEIDFWKWAKDINGSSIFRNLDIYEDSENLNKAFIEFKNNLLDGGFLISNEQVDIKSLKYGISDVSDYIVKNIKCNSSFSQFDLHFNESRLENLKIKLQGVHNVMNSVAAVSIALKLGVLEKQIFKALDSFDGIERRFSYKIDNENIVLIDDYAHHPEEIKQVFKTLKSIYPNEHLLVVFQPHLFSRTRDLLDEFADVLSEFDAVILLDIYPAREEPISGVSSEILLQKIKSNNKYLSKKSDLSDLIKNIGYKVNVTLGAGDIGKEVEHIKNRLEYAV